MNEKLQDLLNQLNRFDLEWVGSGLSFHGENKLMPDRFGDWVRFEDVENLLKAFAESQKDNAQ